MTYILSQRSLGFVTHVDPRMIAVVQKAISISAQDFGFTAEQSRTLAEERILVAAGRSHTLHSHHIIDCEPGWAQPGFSGAIDAVPWDGSKFIWDWNLIYVVAAAFREASIALAQPITWGGCWDLLMSEYSAGPDGMKAASQNYLARYGGHGFVDGPHFELGAN